MRVVLVSIELDAESSAGNLQRLVKAIDQSAATTPPPDLLVLPGACDVPGNQNGSAIADGTLTAVKETIAAKAREWGVYIAIGLHRLQGEAVVPYAALFDSDGDLLNTSHDQMPGDLKDAGVIHNHLIATPVGQLILVEPSKIEPEHLEQTVNANALVVVPWSLSAPKARRKLWSNFFTKLKESKQASTHLYWAVTAAVQKASVHGDDYHLTSMLIGRNGKNLAKANLGEPAILAVDVELPLPVSGTVDKV